MNLLVGIFWRVWQWCLKWFLKDMYLQTEEKRPNLGTVHPVQERDASLSQEVVIEHILGPRNSLGAEDLAKMSWVRERETLKGHLDS